MLKCYIKKLLSLSFILILVVCLVCIIPATTRSQEMEATAASTDPMCICTECNDFRRECIADYMRECATVKWSPAVTTTLRASNSATYTYNKDDIYTGIPFSAMIVSRDGSLEAFSALGDKDSDGVLLVTSPLKGLDKPGAVSYAIGNGSPPLKFTQFASDIFGTGVPDSLKLLTMATTASDISDTDYEKLSKGNILFAEDIGVMVVTANDKVSKKVKIIAQVNRPKDSWDIDKEYTYEELRSKGYFPCGRYVATQASRKVVRPNAAHKRHIVNDYQDGCKFCKYESHEKRQSVIEEMRKMATVRWKVRQNTKLFTINNGNPENNREYLANKVYKGIPYSVYRRNCAYNTFTKHGSWNQDIFTYTKTFAQFLTGNTAPGICLTGSDCVSALNFALLKTGRISLRPSGNGVNAHNCQTITDRNSDDKSQVWQLDNLSKLQPGDFLIKDKVKNGKGLNHAMLVVSNDVANKKITIIDQTINLYANGTTTWHVDYTYDYAFFNNTDRGIYRAYSLFPEFYY